MSEPLNRLLVIDDQPDLCEFIAEVGIHVGYEVRAVTVCAGGMETQAALDFLDDCGCDRAQGYSIGRPMPGEAIPGSVKTWNATQGEP